MPSVAVLHRADRRRRELIVALAAVASGILAPPPALAQSARPVARAENMTLGVAIDRSGRQRMLSQRMAKAYLQVYNRTLVERSRRILDESIAAFSSALAELERFAAGTPVAEAMQRQREAWPRLERALRGEPSMSGCLEVLAASDVVLATAEEATGGFQRMSTLPAPRIVNISGRQRMLSQRMAKHLAFEVADGPGSTQAKIIDDARSQFIAAARELKAFPQNTPEIAGWLDIADAQWAFFDESLQVALKGGQPTALQLENAAKASENILETMDRVTAAYARLAA